MSANAKIFEAREHCKAAERAAKTSMFRWKADYDSAADEYSQAAQCFRIARDLPNSKECHLKASECYKRNNAFFHAAKALENAIIVCKEIAPAEEIYNLAVESASLYQQHGSGDSGAGVLDKAAKILEDKDLDLAVKLFQQAADVSSGNAFEPTAMQINHLLNYIATPLMDSSRNLTVKQLNEWEALKDTLNDLWGPPKTIEEWIEIMAELKIQEGFVRNRGVVATSSIQEVLTVSEDEQAQEIINGPEDEQIEEIIRFPEDECIEEIIRALGDEQAQEIVRVPMDKQAKGIIKVSEEERVRNIKGAPDGDPEQDIIWAPDNDESHEIVRTPNDLPAQIQEVLGTTNDHPAQIPEVIRDNDCLEVIDSEAQEVITFSDDEEPQEVRFPQVPKPLVFLEEPNSDEGVPRSPENSDDEDDSSSIEIVHDNSTAARTSHPLFCMRNPSARHYALTSMEQPHASTATEQPHAATTMEQPHASSTNESTPTEPPHAPTATERPHTATATEQPHESTATEQPHASSHNESTPTEQPHESTATEQPHASSSNESTATEQPHASTATEQPHESDATEQPHALTSSEQPQTSTSASTATKQPHASTSTEQLQTSTSASTATEKPSVSTSTEQPRASTSTEHPRASTSYASISMEQAHASTSYASTSIEQPRASTSYASTSRQQPYASTSYASTSREQSYASTSYASTSYASDWMEHPQPSTSYASTSYASDWLEHPQASTSYASTYASDWMEHPQPSTSYAATSKEYTYARVTSARQIQTAAAESSKMLDPMQGTYGMSRKRRAELMQHSKSKLAKKMHKDKIKSSLKKMYKQLKAQALEETREDPPIPDKNIFGSDPDETESSQHQGSEYISKASRILVKLQRYDQAVDSLRREIGFHQESGNIGAIGRLTVAIVLVQLARGDTVAAEKAYKEWGSNCEVAEMQTLEQILQAYDEEDRESAKRALASPFIRNMDVEYARLAASVPLPEAMEPAPRATVVENAAPSYVSPNASSTTTAEISHVELEESPYAPVTYAKKADDDDGLC